MSKYRINLHKKAIESEEEKMRLQGLVEKLKIQLDTEEEKPEDEQFLIDSREDIIKTMGKYIKLVVIESEKLEQIKKELYGEVV